MTQQFLVIVKIGVEAREPVSVEEVRDILIPHLMEFDGGPVDLITVVEIADVQKDSCQAG